MPPIEGGVVSQIQTDRRLKHTYMQPYFSIAKAKHGDFSLWRLYHAG